MRKEDWLLVLPLAFLFTIGLAGFVMPAWLTGLSIAAKQYTQQDLSVEWLGFFGNIIGGIFTIAAAIIAWFAVQRQIAQSERAIEREAEAERYAARAMLPVALDALHQFSFACLDELKRSGPASPLVVPEISGDTLSVLRDCVRFSDRAKATEVADLISKVQVNSARLRSFGGKGPFRGSSEPALSDNIFDALELMALIDRLYEYGRRPEELGKYRGRASRDELEKQARIYGFESGYTHLSNRISIVPLRP